MSVKKISSSVTERGEYGDFLIKAESYASLVKDKVRLIHEKDKSEIVIEVDPLSKVTYDNFSTTMSGLLDRDSRVYKLFNVSRKDFINEINSTLKRLRERERYPHQWKLRDRKYAVQISSLE